MTSQQIFSFSDESDIFYQGYIFFYSLFKSGQVFIHFANDTLLSSDIYLKVKNKEYKVDKIPFKKLEKFFYSLSIYRQQTFKYLIDNKDSRMSHIAFAIFFIFANLILFLNGLRSAELRSGAV